METEDKDPVRMNHTLYINNLNEKVPLNEMKQTLYLLFSKYGPVLDIIMKKNIMMRGQCFIVFDNLEDAEAAKRAYQGFMLYRKPMNVHYAKAKSDIISKREGEPVHRTRAPFSLKDFWNSRIYKERLSRQPQLNETNDIQAKFARMKIKSKDKEKDVDEKSPNKILFVSELPTLTEDFSLNELFSNYPGFKELRYIPSKHVAFVEYEDEAQAALVMSNLAGFTFDSGETLKIAFAKK